MILNLLIGKTGYSFFDVWTIVHLSFWIFIGSIFWSLKTDRMLAFCICMAVAFAWEIFERFAEKYYPDLWLNPESWINACVSDPLTCIAGLLFIWYVLDNWRL